MARAAPLPAEHAVEVALGRQRPGHRVQRRKHEARDSQDTHRQQHDPGQRGPGPAQHRARVPPHGDEQQRIREQYEPGELVEVREHHGRHDRDRKSTESSAPGHAEVEHREVLGVGSGSGQLSVADHASRDENAAPHQDLDEDREREATGP